MAAPTASSRPAVPPQVEALPRLTVWSAQVLREQLLSEMTGARTLALAMCLQPGAPVDEAAEAVCEACRRTLQDLAGVPLSDRSATDRLPLQLAAAALGQLTPERAPGHVDGLLCDLLRSECDITRTYAAHALWRLGRLPPQSAEPLAALLLVETESARKAAALAASRAPKTLASALVNQLQHTSCERWSVEFLDTLALSAGDERSKRQAIERFLLDAVRSVPRWPAGVAVLTAVARLGLGDQAMQTLAALAEDADEAVALGALGSLARLGESARSVRSVLLAALARTDDVPREEAICRTLVAMRPEAAELPLPRLAERIGAGPDRAAAAHCMLLTLHAKPPARMGDVIRARHARASDALKPVLSATYERLTGSPLATAAS